MTYAPTAVGVKSFFLSAPFWVEFPTVWNRTPVKWPGYAVGGGGGEGRGTTVLDL